MYGLSRRSSSLELSNSCTLRALFFFLLSSYIFPTFFSRRSRTLYRGCPHNGVRETHKVLDEVHRTAHRKGFEPQEAQTRRREDCVRGYFLLVLVCVCVCVCMCGVLFLTHAKLFVSLSVCLSVCLSICVSSGFCSSHAYPPIPCLPE
jgi:hypothetical protein